MNDRYTQKSVSKSVSLPQDLWDEINARCGGDAKARNKFLRPWIESAVSGGSTPQMTNPRPLLSLYETFLPSSTGTVAQKLDAHEANEHRLIEATLIALRDYLVDHYEGGTPRLCTLPEKIGNYVSTSEGAARLVHTMLNEPPPPRAKKKSQSEWGNPPANTDRLPDTEAGA